MTVLQTVRKHALTCISNAKRGRFGTQSAHAEPGGLPSSLGYGGSDTYLRCFGRFLTYGLTPAAGWPVIACYRLRWHSSPAECAKLGQLAWSCNGSSVLLMRGARGRTPPGTGTEHRQR